MLAWSDGAEKHSPIADGLHALLYRFRFLQRFDVDPGTGEVVDLLIGPARDEHRRSFRHAQGNTENQQLTPAEQAYSTALAAIARYLHTV